jgi:hypothetical protein
MIDWLIARAKRTPYYHLDDYMMRWWLVPYRQRVPRIVPAVDPNGELRPGKIWYAEPHIVTDGTGPVPFRSRPIAWLLQRLNISVRIHEILRSDLERHPHSHPWSYLTIILRNYYVEQRYDSEGTLIAYKLHGPGSILWRPAGSVHRLTMERPVTTLFITFKKQGTWGFQVDGKIVSHHEYLR